MLHIKKIALYDMHISAVHSGKLVVDGQELC